MKTERVLKPLQMFWVCSSVLLLVSAVDAQETRKLANDYREWQRFDSRARGQATKGKSKSRTAAQKGRQGDDWPQFRGPGGLGTSAATGIPTQWTPQNIVWKAELPGPGTASPVVIGDRVFFTCYSGDSSGADKLARQVVCLDRSTGRVAWTREVASKFPDQPNIREGHGYASSTPASDGEHVYVFFGKSGVFAFGLDGRPVWRADVGGELHGWGSAASPVLSGNLVIVNASVERESLIALDRRTGKEVWRANGIRESWNTPLLVPVGAKTEVVVAIQGKVLGFDAESGAPLWSCATDIAWYMVPSMVAHDAVIYSIGGRSGGALAVRAGGRGDVTTSHRVWTGRKGSNVSSPIFHKGHLFWAHDNLGIVYCADAKSGAIVYEQRLERAGQFYASPVLAGGNLYYVSRRGRIYVVAATPEFQLLATNDLGDDSTFNASPAVAGNRLLVRSDRYLYCIGQK